MSNSDEKTARGYHGKELREWHEGDNAAHRLGEAVSFAAVTGQKSVVSYNNLTSEPARQGFFDGVISDTLNAEREWGHFYAVVQLMRTEEWYWRKEGYETFDAFWRDKVGDAFATLEELEAVYNFAKMARPELFDIKDFEAVRAELREVDLEIGRLYAVPAAAPHGVRNRRGNQYTASKKDAVARVADAAAFKAPGENSMERRFAKLRRDAPAVAARLLNGEFVRELAPGKWHVDLNAAERAAFSKSNAEKQKERVEKKQKASDTQLLRRMLKTTSAARRSNILAEVSACPWLLEALRENNVLTP